MDIKQINMKRYSKRKLEKILEEYMDTHYPDTANDFAEIIAYLLNGFFKGEFDVDGEKILCSLNSGQKYIVNTQRIN